VPLRDTSDPRRVPQIPPREVRHLSGHRRREEQRLTITRDGGQDAVELGLEPHVQHPVRLVEDQQLDVTERDVPGLEMVDEPPGVAMRSWGREWSAIC
jgi:hypothetical protein